MFIDRLEQARSERPVNLESRVDHYAGDLIGLSVNPLVSLAVLVFLVIQL
jgi:hypothetical protein